MVKGFDRHVEGLGRDGERGGSVDIDQRCELSFGSDGATPVLPDEQRGGDDVSLESVRDDLAHPKVRIKKPP